MNLLVRTFLAAGAVALLLSHCGGQTDSPARPLDGGSGGGPEGGTDGGVVLPDSGMCEGTAGGGETPTEHRPTATACAPTPPPLQADGGPAASCNTAADCQPYLHCSDHVCSFDACLVDSDCPVSNVCVCSASAGGGLRQPGNVCVPSSCQVDSDCGQGHVCEPSRGYCGSVDGYHCTSSKDTCVDATKDCSCGGNACAYAPTVGHFVCATSVCNG
jgi:hypothetical protein